MKTFEFRLNKVKMRLDKKDESSLGGETTEITFLFNVDIWSLNLLKVTKIMLNDHQKVKEI